MPKVTIERLRELISYNPDTGVLVWIKNPALHHRKVGCRCGAMTREGYVRLAIGGQYLMAHRVAWAIHFGAWPSGMLDHVNQIKSDNRISNLRLATASQNVANRGARQDNSHGAKGVTRLPRGKWQAQIKLGGKNRYLGSFELKHDAVKAYQAAAIEAHGPYASSQEAA
jgi:hypothetical protein